MCGGGRRLGGQRTDPEPAQPWAFGLVDARFCSGRSCWGAGAVLALGAATMALAFVLAGNQVCFLGAARVRVFPDEVGPGWADDDSFIEGGLVMCTSAGILRLVPPEPFRRSDSVWSERGVGPKEYGRDSGRTGGVGREVLPALGPLQRSPLWHRALGAAVAGSGRAGLSAGAGLDSHAVAYRNLGFMVTGP